MKEKANGFFEAFVNSRAATLGPAEKAAMLAVLPLVQAASPRSQVRWAGSQRKGTGIVGSDLDICVGCAEPVTEAARRALRAELARTMGRQVTIHTHVVRVAAGAGLPKIDIAFANTAFGCRPLPDLAEFKDRAPRQSAARALKLWTRSAALPRVPGWALEALVVHLDAPAGRSGLALLQRILAWIESTATPASVEGVLRHANFGSWNPAWSPKARRTLEALRQQSVALRRRNPAPESWRSAGDVRLWLCP